MIPDHGTPHHVEPVPAGALLNAWAGGRLVLVPGAGPGRVVSDASDAVRVVEVDLPAPATAVFLVDHPDGRRGVVVLTDPRIEPSQLDDALAAARALAIGHEPPAIPPPRRADQQTRASRRVRSSAWTIAALIMSSEFGLTACTALP